MGNRIKFVAGQTYTLVVKYSVAEGYELQEGATLTYTLANGFNGEIVPSSGTIIPQYTVPATATYTVSFAANGGSGTMPAITGVSGAYTLPECGFTAPTGKQFKCWKVSRLLQMSAGSTITVTENISLTAVWEDIPNAATVSGNLTSYGSKTENVTIHLIPEGTSEAAYELIVAGDATSYSIANVPPGTYTLRISKLNHTTREYTVVVGDTDVTKDVKICLTGDVTGEGTCNIKDFQRLLKHVNKTNPLY